jgi:Xylose isomerase-like TIM barrel.
MEFGLCSGTQLAEAAKAAGFTYLDGTVGDVIMPNATEAEFEDSYAQRFAGAALPLRNLAVLLPGSIRLAGPDANTGEAIEFVGMVFARAKKIGLRSIAFGSGGARKCPEEWDKAKAVGQITAFVAGIAPAVKASGVKLGIENLRFAETNTLNMLAEVADVIDAAGAGAEIGLLVDGYHWNENADTAAALARIAGKIHHAHIATSPSRWAPGEEPTDFAPFAKLLKAAGYNGMMSVEAAINDSSPEGLARIHATLDAAFNRQ